MLAGIAVQLRQEALWTKELYAALVLAGGLGSVAARFMACRPERLRAVLCGLACAALGLGATGWRPTKGGCLPEFDGRDLV
jgi:hypothetical protein